MSNLFKKIISASSALLIVFSIVSPFAGVMAAYSTLESANKLASLGVIVDQSANPANYRLGDSITRGEMAKVTMKLSETDVADVCNGKFSDLKTADWACKYAEAGLALGYFAANDIFRPMAVITKSESLKMIMKARDLEKSSNSDWQAAYVEAAVEAGILDAAFTDYNAVAQRGWIFQTAVNAIEGATDDDDSLLGDLLGDLDDDDDTNTGTTDDNTTVATGDLGVDLSPKTMKSQSVPSNGTVNFGTIDFSAGNEDASLTSVKLVRQGLGSRSDFTRVWMEKSGVRVSGRQTVGSDDTVYITFSPAVIIKAGSTVSLDLIASLNAGSNSQNKFTIQAASDVVSAGTVGGTFPISTETMTTTSYTVVPVTFEGAGSNSTYRVGNTNVELGQFKLTNGSTNDKSVTFKSISLRNDGTGDANSSLSNLGLYKNAVKISTAVSFDGKNTIFAVDDKIDFGRTETYYIRGDVVTAELTSGDTYEYTLRYSDDLSVDETVTNFRSTITITPSTVAVYKVSGGDIILSKSTDTTSSQTVAPGSNDVVLLSADLKVSQSVTLEDLKIGFTSGLGIATNLSTTFSSIKLMIGNSVVASYTPSTTAIVPGTRDIILEGTTTVNADTTLKIVGNIKTNATPAIGTYKLLDVDANHFNIKEYAGNGNAIAFTQVIGSVNGVSTSIGSAVLSMTRNDGLPPQTLSVGSSDQTLIQFSMRANDVSDIDVSKIKFTPAVGSNVIPTNVTNLRLYVNNAIVSNKNMSSGNADFNDINVKIAKNTDVNVKVVADFSTAIVSGETFQLKLDSVEARDGNSITLITAPAVAALSLGVDHTFVPAGTAKFTVNSATPNASILTPASAEIELARFNVAALNDSLKLTDLYIQNVYTAGADLASSIKSIGLYDKNGTKLAGGSVIGTDTVLFALGNSSTFVVPKNTSNSELVVKAAFNDVTDISQTNKGIELRIGHNSRITPPASFHDGARMISDSTGNEVVTIDTLSTYTKPHLLVRSKPVIAVSSAATLTSHTFTVTADANNNITLATINLALQNPSANGGTYEIFRDQELPGNSIYSGPIVTGSNTISADISDTEISAGTTKTFIVKLDGTLLSGNAANAKRIMKVTDLSYLDMMNTGSNSTIASVSSYSNVGLPTVESTFTY